MHLTQERIMKWSLLPILPASIIATFGDVIGDNYPNVAWIGGLGWIILGTSLVIFTITFLIPEKETRKRIVHSVKNSLKKRRKRRKAKKRAKVLKKRKKAASQQ